MGRAASARGVLGQCIAFSLGRRQFAWAELRPSSTWAVHECVVSHVRFDGMSALAF